jgi:hypothetical protein
VGVLRCRVQTGTPKLDNGVGAAAAAPVFNRSHRRHRAGRTVRSALFVTCVALTAGTIHRHCPCLCPVDLSLSVCSARTAARAAISLEGVAIVTSCSHTLALDAEGRVYAWGRASFGRLGLGGDVDPCAITVQPTHVKALSTVRR